MKLLQIETFASSLSSTYVNKVINVLWEEGITSEIKIRNLSDFHMQENPIPVTESCDEKAMHFINELISANTLIFSLTDPSSNLAHSFQSWINQITKTISPALLMHFPITELNNLLHHKKVIVIIEQKSAIKNNLLQDEKYISTIDITSLSEAINIKEVHCVFLKVNNITKDLFDVMHEQLHHKTKVVIKKLMHQIKHQKQSSLSYIDVFQSLPCLHH